MNSSNNQNKIKYIQLLYISAVVLFSSYIWSFNFRHQISNYNIILIPLYLAILVSPLSYKLTNDITKIALATYIPSITLLGVILYVSEGLESTEAHWIIIIPILASLIFGFRGVLGGIVLLGLFIGIYLLGHHFNWLPHLVAKRTDFQFEHRFSIVMFCIFISLMAIFIVYTEKKRLEQTFHSQAETNGLIRIIIHDIAAPLLNIRALLFKLLEKQGQEDNSLTHSLQAINHQIDNMDKILSRVREMRAVVEGKMKIQLTPLLVQNLVQDSIKLLSPKAEKKGIRIISSFKAESNPIILADEALFKNAILGNIFSNAIKFSKPGSQIDFRCIAQEETITIEIQDYGVGMHPHTLNNLFDTSQPTNRPGTAGEKGTGLGMIIVKEWTEKHGGQIHVESHEKPSPSGPRGTLFRLVFPRYMKEIPQKEDNVIELKKAS